MKRVLKFVTRLEMIVVGAILAAMSAATFWNVVARYVFNSPVDWAEEFSRYAFIWLTFMAAVVATAEKRQIVIDILVTHLPKRGQYVCRVATDLVTLALMATIAYYGWFTAQAASSRTATLGIPRSWIYMAAPVAAVLIFGHTLADFLVALGVRKDERERA
jgi:TRAP-type C4-dicarboxylate transport system permease small subunit